jgi:hypothetical protein
MPTSGSSDRKKRYMRLWMRVRNAKTPQERALRLEEKEAVFPRLTRMPSEERLRRHRITSSKWAARNRAHLRRRDVEYRTRERYLVMSHYSGGVPRCACCGETIFIFLTMDHLPGSHRGKDGRSGNRLIHYLHKNGFPPGYQVFCYNCNLGKRSADVCPHVALGLGKVEMGLVSKSDELGVVVQGRA